MIEFSVGQNLGILGATIALFILWGVTERAFYYHVWGLRVVHFTALALAAVLIMLDAMLALVAGRLISASATLIIAGFLIGQVVSDVRKLRRTYERMQRNRRQEQVHWIERLFRVSAFYRFWDRMEQFLKRYQDWKRNRDLYKAEIQEEAHLRAERKLAAEDAAKQKEGAEQANDVSVA